VAAIRSGTPLVAPPNITEGAAFAGSRDAAGPDPDVGTAAEEPAAVEDGSVMEQDLGLAAWHSFHDRGQFGANSAGFWP
jgi:hypothetical protein